MHIEKVIGTCAQGAAALSAIHGVLGMRFINVAEMGSAAHAAVRSVQEMPVTVHQETARDTADTLATALKGSEHGERVAAHAGFAASALEVVVERHAEAEQALVQAAATLDALAVAIKSAYAYTGVTVGMAQTYIQTLSPEA
jgi:hypothetical protein